MVFNGTYSALSGRLQSSYHIMSMYLDPQLKTTILNIMSKKMSRVKKCIHSVDPIIIYIHIAQITLYYITSQQVDIMR